MNSAQNEEDSGQGAVVNALDSVVGGQYNSAQNDIHTIRRIFFDFLLFFFYNNNNIEKRRNKDKKENIIIIVLRKKEEGVLLEKKNKEVGIYENSKILNTL